MKMYLISDNVDTYTGMRLAGVEGCVVHERQELKDALERSIADKEIGVGIVKEKCASLRAEFRKLAKQAFNLIKI